MTHKWTQQYSAMVHLVQEQAEVSTRDVFPGACQGAHVCRHLYWSWLSSHHLAALALLAPPETCVQLELSLIQVFGKITDMQYPLQMQ